MEFRVDHRSLAEAVAWTARTLPARPALPVLAGMRIDAGAEGVALATFDYEVSTRAVADASVAEPGRVLVPGRLLTAIVRSLPPQPVDIRTSGADVVVRCGSAEFGLLTMPIEDYPAVPVPPDPAGTVEGDLFARAVAQVVVAASRDDTLPMLTGVRIDIEGNVIRMACTDRYRIAMRELSWEPAGSGFGAAVVVPARTLADAVRSLKAGSTISLSLAGVADSLLGIDSGGRNLTTRLLDDQFIDYCARFAGERSTIAEVPTVPFIEAIKRVALVTERNIPIRLAFGGDGLRIRAAAGDAARASETLAVRLTGEEVDVAFNPRYLLDGLAGIGGEVTRLECAGPTRPALLTAGSEKDTATPAENGGSAGVAGTESFRYLVMPVRLTG